MKADEMTVSVRPYYSFPSFRDDVLQEHLSMEKAKDNRTGMALDFQYGFAFKEGSRFATLYPGVREGAGLRVDIFEYPKNIGVPVSLYLFQGAPVCRFGERLSLDYEWNFGVSGGWKPTKGDIAESTLIVGSRFNAYINLGLGLRYRLGKDLSLTAGLDLTHFSDGNTSFPNPGVNLFGVRVGMVKSLGDESKGTPFRSDSTFCKGISYDLMCYGAWRKRVYRGGEKPLLLGGHYGIAGINFAPMWDLKRWLRVGVSADFQWDGSSDLKRHYIGGDTQEDIRFSKVPFFSQTAVGLSLRGELVMPVFSVNIGCGYNFIGPPEARASYQMANLKIYANKRLYLNIGYQLQNFQRQNNLMLGLGWKI
ncbi:MAG: acyloxyacyl hydrolase [Muribaculaceae bacterium]|nr:acyloxyacyl hydrolase [Muribaculaceae bacterium]